MAFRVAIVGMGHRGRDWVSEVRRTNGFELVACADPDHRALREASNNLDIEPQQVFGSLEEALEQVDCDGVIIASSPDSHASTCHAALERGFAVMVEKPFTLALGDAVKLVSMAEEKEVPLLVAQNYRYMRVHRTVRRLVGEGRLGRVLMVVSQYYRVPHEMAPSQERLAHSIWWGPGVHHIDALRFNLGQDVVGVAAQTFESPWNGGPEGTSVQALLSFEAGSRGSYCATYESSGHEFFERGQEFYQRFVGELATLHVFHRWLMLCERGKLARVVRRGPREVTEESILLQQLKGAVVDGEEPETSGRDNLQTMATVEACIRSSQQNRWINPQELLLEKG